MIYRVIVATCECIRPEGGSYWRKTVAYCGENRAQALIVYHTNEPADFSYGPGNRARDTTLEALDPSDSTGASVGTWESLDE